MGNVSNREGGDHVGGHVGDGYGNYYWADDGSYDWFANEGRPPSNGILQLASVGGVAGGVNPDYHDPIVIPFVDVPEEDPPYFPHVGIRDPPINYQPWSGDDPVVDDPYEPPHNPNVPFPRSFVSSSGSSKLHRIERLGGVSFDAMPFSRKGRRSFKKKSWSKKKRSVSVRKGPARNRVVDAPVSIGTRTITRDPIVSNRGKSCRIRHRELVMPNVNGTSFINTTPGVFTLNTMATTNAVSIQLQPGLASVFPWLAPQAAQWETYKVHAMVIEYIPICATSSPGDIIIAPDYSAIDSPPPDTAAGELTATSFVDAVTDSVWKRIDCVLSPSAMMALGPRRYVRTTAKAGDKKTYDVGQVFIGNSNCTANSPLGKIFVSYDIEFFTPQVNVTRNAQQTTCLVKSTAASSPSTGTDTPIPAWLISDDNVTAGGLAGGLDVLRITTAATLVTGSFVPPAGTYRIDATASFDFTAGTTATAELKIFRNGVACIPPFHSSVSNNNNAGDDLCVSVHGVVVCSGTDVITLVEKLTFGAGAGTLIASRAQMIWALA